MPKTPSETWFPCSYEQGGCFYTMNKNPTHFFHNWVSWLTWLTSVSGMIKWQWMDPAQHKLFSQTLSNLITQFHDWFVTICLLKSYFFWCFVVQKCLTRAHCFHSAHHIHTDGRKERWAECAWWRACAQSAEHREKQ